MNRILIEWKKKINKLKHSIKFKRAGGIADSFHAMDHFIWHFTVAASRLASAIRA